MIRQAIRTAIDRRGWGARSAVARAAGIGPGNLCNFLNGKKGLGIDKLEAVCAHLGLALAKTKGGAK